MVAFVITSVACRVVSQSSAGFCSTKGICGATLGLKKEKEVENKSRQTKEENKVCKKKKILKKTYKIGTVSSGFKTYSLVLDANFILKKQRNHTH